jgi:hypothetical protein
VLIQISGIAIPSGNSLALPKENTSAPSSYPCHQHPCQMLGIYFQQHKYLPKICAGAAKELTILHKYYLKTDELVMYLLQL